MKKTTLKLINSFIAILLSLTFVLPQISLVAMEPSAGLIENTTVDELLDSIDFMIPNPEDFNEEEALRRVMQGLSPEAEKIFQSYLAYDSAALKTYQKIVNPNFQIQGLNFNVYAAAISDAQILQSLSSSLRSIGLSSTMVTMFLGIGSTILAATTITAAVIVLALTAASVYQIIVGQWGSLSGLWTKIKNAFSSAFSSKVSTSTTSTAFSNTQTTYKQAFEKAVNKDLEKICRDARIGNCDKAAKAMKDYLTQRKQKGGVITLSWNQNQVTNKFIWCISKQKTAGYNYFHQGVTYNGRTFCVVHTNGLVDSGWVRDFIMDFNGADVFGKITKVSF